jgi:hypothetical protein
MAEMIRTYAVKLKGLTPLLMHWDNIEWADEMELWRADPQNQDRSKRGDDRSPAHTWIGSVYHDGKQVCMSSDNLSRCCMEAGALVPVAGKGKKTFKSQTQSGMKIDEMYVPLLINGGSSIPWGPIQKLTEEPSFPEHMAAVKKMGFALFMKRVPIGRSKHIRVRPRFQDWSLSFHVSVWDEQITVPVLTNIFTIGGSYKGLCDWRPGVGTPGSWGMFKLAELKKA